MNKKDLKDDMVKKGNIYLQTIDKSLEELEESTRQIELISKNVEIDEQKALQDLKAYLNRPSKVTIEDFDQKHNEFMNALEKV